MPFLVTNVAFSHAGTPLECVYALLTFGIPRVVLPIQEDGTISVENHTRWLAIRSKQETETTVVSRIVVPGPFDVLMGRGKTIEGNPGNLRLHHLIETNGPRYAEASKFEKTVVAETLLGLIKDMGGRFLKKGETGWVVIQDEVARDKVSHAFRNHRTRTAQKVEKRNKKMPFPSPMPTPSSGEVKRTRR
jgi:hypothetical protein